MPAWRSLDTRPGSSTRRRGTAGFGEQLLAMLNTSGNWLKCCGEICAVFLRPILLTDSVGGIMPSKMERKWKAPPFPPPGPAISQHCRHLLWLLCFHVLLSVLGEQQSVNVSPPPSQCSPKTTFCEFDSPLASKSVF